MTLTLDRELVEDLVQPEQLLTKPRNYESIDFLAALRDWTKN